MENNHGDPPAAALSPTELELNAWRELGEEMGRVISLMPAETFADWFPDWFGPRLFDLQVGAKASAALSPTFPIPLNEKQEAVVKLWALPTTPGMWGSPETVEFNLRTFARKILAEAAALSPSEEPKK